MPWYWWSIWEDAETNESDDVGESFPNLWAGLQSCADPKDNQWQLHPTTMADQLALLPLGKVHRHFFFVCLTSQHLPKTVAHRCGTSSLPFHSPCSSAAKGKEDAFRGHWLRSLVPLPCLSQKLSNLWYLWLASHPLTSFWQRGPMLASALLSLVPWDALKGRPSSI